MKIVSKNGTTHSCEILDDSGNPIDNVKSITIHGHASRGDGLFKVEMELIARPVIVEVPDDVVHKTMACPFCSKTIWRPEYGDQAVERKE